MIKTNIWMIDQNKIHLVIKTKIIITIKINNTKIMIKITGKFKIMIMI